MPYFFYVLDFPKRKLSYIKIGTTNNITRRTKEVERLYHGKANILYVKTCETQTEVDDLEDLSRVILRRAPNLVYLPKDRFIYQVGNRPDIPIPVSTNINCEVHYI